MTQPSTDSGSGGGGGGSTSSSLFEEAAMVPRIWGDVANDTRRRNGKHLRLKGARSGRNRRDKDNHESTKHSRDRPGERA